MEGHPGGGLANVHGGPGGIKANCTDPGTRRTRSRHGGAAVAAGWG